MQKVYLLLGKEQGLKDDYLAELLSFLKKKDSSLNVNKVFSSELSLIELSEKFLSNSLFVKNEVFIVYEAELIKNKKDITFIGNVLEKAKNKSVIFVSNENSISIDKMEAVELVRKVFYELSEVDKFKFMKSKFFELGLKATDAAINLMTLMLDSDTKVLRFYIDSFANFAKNKNINEEDIKSWLTFIRPENTFSLFESILKKDTENSLVKAKSIIEQGDDLISIMTSLTWQFKRLLKIQIDSKGTNLQVAFKKNRIFFSLEKSYKLGVKNYSIYEIKEVLKILYKFDLYSRLYPKSMHLNLAYLLIFCVVSQSETMLENFDEKFIYNF